MTQDCVSAYGQPSFHFSLNGARSMADSYVLGDLDNEIARLEIQSSVSRAANMSQACKRRDKGGDELP
jgi:hypothetical protein